MKRDDLLSTFGRKGFEIIDRGKKLHHIKIVLMYNGKVTHIRTRVSMGSHGKNIDNKMLSKIAKDLKMENKEKVKDYKICDYSYDAYIDDLNTNGDLV